MHEPFQEILDLSNNKIPTWLAFADPGRNLDRLQWADSV